MPEIETGHKKAGSLEKKYRLEIPAKKHKTMMGK